MARVNVDECWWSDPRRDRLGALVKSSLLADAVALRAWKVSQDYWANKCKLVPIPIFRLLPHSDALLESGLAELRDDFVYVRGAKDRHAWILSRRQNGALGGMASRGVGKQREKRTANASKRKQTQASSSSSSSRNKTNNALNAQKYDFEKLANQYPRRRDLRRGIKKCELQIKTQEDYDALASAIGHFAEYHKSKRTESQMIPYFKTFVSGGEWREWISGCPEQSANQNFTWGDPDAAPVSHA